jgi:hypothetical protein
MKGNLALWLHGNMHTLTHMFPVLFLLSLFQPLISFVGGVGDIHTFHIQPRYLYNYNNRELLYAPEDITRSSPFFWALEQAFPEQQQQQSLLRQVFSITDAIPAPFKEIGPAYQTIELDETNGSGGGGGRGAGGIRVMGKLISRVKVATLNGKATSIMTTRSDIVESIGVDSFKLRIDTTKPEQSTVISTLFPGPLGNWIMDNVLPSFPSGEMLERIQPGSSTVLMRTTFCDESIRISRWENNNNHLYDNNQIISNHHPPFVWRRCRFAGSETI